MSVCVLDTDAVIAALDRGDAHHGEAARAIRRMIEEDVATINYAEALVSPAEGEQTLRAAVDAIAALGIKAIPPGVAVARDAARHRALGISLADGFALTRWLATPPTSGCPSGSSPDVK